MSKKLLPKSPFSLLQEEVWPDRWKSTLACILLNVTKRSQVNSVYPALFEMIPTPEMAEKETVENLQIVLKPLGLSNKRAITIKKLSKAWLDGVNFDDLPGIGKYASDSDKIFYRGELPSDVKDHKLVEYLEWKKDNGKLF